MWQHACSFVLPLFCPLTIVLPILCHLFYGFLLARNQGSERVISRLTASLSHWLRLFQVLFCPPPATNRIDQSSSLLNIKKKSQNSCPNNSFRGVFTQLQVEGTYISNNFHLKRMRIGAWGSDRMMMPFTGFKRKCKSCHAEKQLVDKHQWRVQTSWDFYLEGWKSASAETRFELTCFFQVQ